MATKLTRQPDEPRHEHRWVLAPDRTEERCSCGKLRVTREELAYRAGEWEDYFRIVVTTPAYQDYLEMRQAFAAKDLERIREIDARVMTRNTEVITELGERKLVANTIAEWLPKPSFPDPRSSDRYLVLEESDLERPS